MPGELVRAVNSILLPPTDKGGAQKTYTLIITVGSDRHVVEIAQGHSLALVLCRYTAAAEERDDGGLVRGDRIKIMPMSA